MSKRTPQDASVEFVKFEQLSPVAQKIELIVKAQKKNTEYQHMLLGGIYLQV